MRRHHIPANLCTAPEVGDAVVVGTALQTAEVGQSLIYKCNGTTLFPGGTENKQITCDDTGEWFEEPPLSGCDGETTQPYHLIHLKTSTE